jgi:D-serine deaminase-like pyridoxal phosphate-dependent protein
MRLADVPTPALCVDVETLDANIARMAAFFRGRACGLRPHVKAHKTPAIAARQAAAGCVGFTCATIDEAEMLARHGLENLLIANEIVDRTKLPRLRALAERARVTVAVDSHEGAAALRGLAVEVLLDVDIGLPRCGVPPGEARALAAAIAATPLPLRGVMGYEGHAMGIADPSARTETARVAIATLLEVAEELRADGHAITVVSAGGTGTYAITGTMPGVTELQAGSYALMDTTYARYGLPFGEALRCLTTVVSVHANLAVLDAGLKSLAVDHGNPELPADVPASVLFLSDEHTSLALTPAFSARPGDRLWLRPSHVDPTVNLHDRLYAIRDETVVEVWDVEARGYRS